MKYIDFIFQLLVSSPKVPQTVMKKGSHECMRICIHMNKNKMLSVSYFWKKGNQTLDMKTIELHRFWFLSYLSIFKIPCSIYFVSTELNLNKMLDRCTRQLWNDIEMLIMLFSLETVFVPIWFKMKWKGKEKMERNYVK